MSRSTAPRPAELNSLSRSRTDPASGAILRLRLNAAKVSNPSSLHLSILRAMISLATSLLSHWPSDALEMKARYIFSRRSRRLLCCMNGMKLG